MSTRDVNLPDIMKLENFVLRLSSYQRLLHHQDSRHHEIAYHEQSDGKEVYRSIPPSVTGRRRCQRIRKPMVW
eukprot:650481-Hanusia_phi.AAC.1